jgi:uncharacterized protein
MRTSKYVCPKCGSRDYDTEIISTTGGIFSRIFNLQHKKFTALTCKRCTYTELYKTESNKIENVFDFITG